MIVTYCYVQKVVVAPSKQLGVAVWTVDVSCPAAAVFQSRVMEPQPIVVPDLSLIHISEPTRQAEISYAVFCLKKMN